ncbi:integrase arm-type DNA-binding domain-containing protein [Sphingomonas yunnanensis]|nr:integrase arm-type DNA-binding domain-containing protein [Sphingomonas yunnanensis]
MLTFGPYPGISLARARQLREDASRSLRDGIDPSVRKRQRVAAQVAETQATFELIARDWHRSQRPVWFERYASTILNSLVNDVFPKIGKSPVSAVTTPLVLEVLRPIEARGAVETAHRTRQRISEVFARAIALGLAQTDPAAVRVASSPASGARSTATRYRRVV